jgi:hypothetical protein
LYPADLPKEWVERKDLTRESELLEKAMFIVKPSATGNKGELWISYNQHSDGAWVMMSFFAN